MRFVVDNQLPEKLSKWLTEQGHDSVHVLQWAQDRTDDRNIWRMAHEEGRIVISKDEDFFLLATRPNESGKLLWVRLGNCRTAALLIGFASAWPKIVAAFQEGQRIVQLQ